MKKVLIFIIVSLMAVICALYIKEDQGYVLLYYKNTIVETSLWMGIILWLTSFFVLHNSLNFIRFCFKLPARSKEFWQKHKQHKVYAETSLGLLKLAEGNFKKAYHALMHSAGLQEKPLINYLTAAKAAQELGDINKRDSCLRKAFECSPKSGLSIGIMQANLQCCNHEYEAALATLNHLQQKYGVNKLVLKQLLEVYINLKDWYKLIKLLPDLKRYKIISEQEILEYEIMAAKHYCAEYGKYNNSHISSVHELNHDSSLEVFYNKELTKQAKNNYEVVTAYVNSLLLDTNQDMKLVLTNKAVAIIEKALSANSTKEAEKNLIKLLGAVVYTEEHVRQLERLLKSYSYNIELLFVLGKLTMSLEQYDKAYQYLNQASRLLDNTAYDLPVNYYLAFVLLQLGREKEGTALFIRSFK